MVSDKTPGMRLTGLLLLVALSAPASGQPLYSPFALRPEPKAAWTKILDDMEEYERTEYTQRIYNLGERTDKVSRWILDAKWHQSGGMEGIEGFRSRLYRHFPEPVHNYVGRIYVANSFVGQWEVGLMRTYPEGTRFIDRLSCDGQDFEVRMREKRKGKWTSKVIYSSHATRPKGYTGLTVSCASCHDESGTGDYDLGLTPGGDGVISDELDWSLRTGLTLRQRRTIRGY